MKTEFVLECHDGLSKSVVIKIIGERPSKPCVMIVADGSKSAFVKDKDLERFAINILKALKSKKLKQ